MDDHLYYMVKGYAECELIPRFQKEYKEYGRIYLCPSWHEMSDFVEALNDIGTWAGFNPVKINDFLPFE